MADPNDMILPLLREMRAENAALHGVTKARLDVIEQTLVSYRHALSADSLERSEALERRVRELEGHQ